MPTGVEETQYLLAEPFDYIFFILQHFAFFLSIDRVEGGFYNLWLGFNNLRRYQIRIRNRWVVQNSWIIEGAGLRGKSPNDIMANVFLHLRREVRLRVFFLERQ